MVLYDSVIQDIRQLFEGCGLAPLKGEPWPDGGKNQLIFREDTVCELGGGTKPALGGTVITGSEAPGEDGIYLLGPDIPQLSGNVPYARVAIVRVRKDKMGADNALYQAIRKTEYVRYHVAPEGFQLGISARTKRETARVSFEAQRKGLGFSQVGKLFLDGYHSLPWVESAQIIFITEPNFAYQKLSEMLDKTENITMALDHLLQKVKMDCNACKLKDICAGVEELCAAESRSQNAKMNGG